MRFDIKRELLARSDRVKGIDFHPTEPWVLTTLYSGSATIWNYQSGTTVKTIDAADVPIRAGRFIASKNWIVVGTDDCMIRVFNVYTGEKVAQFEAHSDYIRSIVVHPTRPFVLSAGDDMVIKLWDWENDWKCAQVFEGHTHYVMCLAINPKDTNTFASAGLDRTVKIWSFGSPVPNFTLEAHDTRGVNFVDYYPLSDKPYIITASDDHTVKIHDYQTKGVVATLEGHTANVSFAVFHPELPIIISGAEDSTIKIWHSSTFKLEQSINYGLERAWCAATRKGSNSIGFGFDEGTVVISLGRDNPAVSMDPSGKLIWARHAEVFNAVIKGTEEVTDGEQLLLGQKELGNVEVYPQQLIHSPNGRFVAVCGDGEYIIYTALAWRNKSFGSALEFAWAQDSHQYAVRESASSVKVFSNFKERPAGHLKLTFAADGIFGGALLGIRGPEWITFFDWDTGIAIRQIDVVPTAVYWSPNGELVALATDDGLYILKFNREDFVTALQDNTIDPDDGVESAFDVITDQADIVTSGAWVGDCFIYTTSTNRLNYLVGQKTYSIAHHSSPYFVLGYMTKSARVYLTDRNFKIVSYLLSLKVVEYQTLVLRGDMETAAEILAEIPKQDYTKVARFLEAQGYKQEALELTTDPEHKFDLSLSLGKLSIAEDIAQATGDRHKFRSLGDAALEHYNITLAQTCFEKAEDWPTLLLVYTSTNDAESLIKLAEKAQAVGQNNLAFNALWAAGDVSKCVDLLVKTGKSSEATLMALTYGLDADAVAKKWRQDLLDASNETAANALIMPSEDPEKFVIDAEQEPASALEPEAEQNGYGAEEDLLK
ncbi:hypothetical protein CANCADRAFT_105966 [Tortispora caseinolytica NRRL Y-17796]|uniref:Coatomer subunit beta' n=1 Tax=Tortispora caseinolytica NRRL Y-17796 TaxID=767744 RepID=A0A1E4TF13_9ASCO|nr:hypothetical protein CANCADRAFT_105966 [Tortispora caseinolytica NRRL Y-17796]